MAASGHGGECYCGQQGGFNDIAALAAGAIGAFLLYQAITMAAGRKRREAKARVSPFEIASDVLFSGKDLVPVLWFLKYFLRKISEKMAVST
jgi:hypothetical protein